MNKIEKIRKNSSTREGCRDGVNDKEIRKKEERKIVMKTSEKGIEKRTKGH